MRSLLVADDSATMRLALRRILEEGGEFRVLGEADSGTQAVELAGSLKPDLVTMDVMMPGLDGFEATRAILERGPARIVIVSAAAEALHGDLSFRALQSGALDLVDKPEARDAATLRDWGRRLKGHLLDLAGLPLGARPGAARPLARPRPSLAARSLRAFGIAASTGGPPALAELLKGLPRELPFPVLVAQHIAPGFTPALARWLGTQTNLEVRVAEGGEEPKAGTVWLPRDHGDLLWRSGRLGVLDNPGGLCPNGDRLLASLAKELGKAAGGAVLTGMGADGAQGLLELKQAGGLTFAQDEASCVVYGMPQQAVLKGAAEGGYSPQEIGFLLAELGRLRA